MWRSSPEGDSDVTEGNIFAIARSPMQYSFYYMANSRNLYLVLIHPVIKISKHKYHGTIECIGYTIIATSHVYGTHLVALHVKVEDAACEELAAAGLRLH